MSRKVAKKTLLLMRHGKADALLSAHESALMKPLDDAGKRNAQRMGAWLAAQALIPDEILSSSAERAIVSAEKCVKSMGIGVLDLRVDHRLFKAEAKRFIKSISRLSEHSRCVLVVADGAGLAALMHALLPEGADIQKLKATSMAVLSLNSPWPDLLGKGSVKLDQCVHAADLPRQFPFPDPNSSELRDRPSYYYRQSAVIPYRFKHQRIEILLIGSSSNKHWVVPKGIHEPGMSARNSAAKEALEEAGAEGMVGHKPLGEYAYAKWGAVCQVKVFPMRVGHMQNKKEWQESHRKRQWCSVKKAKSVLHQQALVQMLNRLVKTVSDQ